MTIISTAMIGSDSPKGGNPGQNSRVIIVRAFHTTKSEQTSFAQSSFKRRN